MGLDGQPLTKLMRWSARLSFSIGVRPWSTCFPQAVGRECCLACFCHVALRHLISMRVWMGDGLSDSVVCTLSH